MINGLAAYGLGRLDEAAAILEQSMAAHRASGDHFDLALDINAFALCVATRAGIPSRHCS